MWQALAGILSQVLEGGNSSAKQAEAARQGVFGGEGGTLASLNQPPSGLAMGGVTETAQPAAQGGGIWDTLLKRLKEGGAQEMKEAQAMREKTLGDLYGSNVLNRLWR